PGSGQRGGRGSGVANPPSESNVEDGHEERQRGAARATHARIGRRARNRHRGSERGATLSIELEGRHEPFAAQSRVLAEHGPVHVIAAVLGREHERCGLALLPREVAPADQIERAVHDGVRTGIVRRCLLDVEGSQRYVVTRIEAGEPVWLAIPTMRRSEIAANETVLVEVMNGELVDVDAPRE